MRRAGVVLACLLVTGCAEGKKDWSNYYGHQRGDYDQPRPQRVWAPPRPQPMPYLFVPLQQPVFQPAQLPQPRVTNCSPDFIGGMRCITH
jgi:hypothetical protein